MATHALVCPKTWQRIVKTTNPFRSGCFAWCWQTKELPTPLVMAGRTMCLLQLSLEAQCGYTCCCVCLRSAGKPCKRTAPFRVAVLLSIGTVSGHRFMGGVPRVLRAGAHSTLCVPHPPPKPHPSIAASMPCTRCPQTAKKVHEKEGYVWKLNATNYLATDINRTKIMDANMSQKAKGGKGQQNRGKFTNG